MIKLKELEEVMRPQFVWDRSSQKYMQCNEEYEGNKDLARSIFVGISDMYGFEATSVMEYLDMGYDSYRHKLTQFREYYREGKRRADEGILYDMDDAIRKFYIKVMLVLNCIKTRTRRSPFLKMDEYINI